jgi:sirohydrochlorin ferrochelatase
MNDRQQHDRQQLEHATSRELPADVQLDDRARSLREGWLALGRAVERSGSEFDSDALTARLQAELATIQPAEAARQQANASWWAVLLGTALALTMLIAAIRSLNNDGGQLPVANHPAAIGEPRTITSTNSAVEEAALGAWSDPLDEELDKASEVVQSLVAGPPTIDDSLSGLSEQLQSLASEFENGSL